MSSKGNYMFVENKKFEPFASEFQKCFKELTNSLSKIWKEYDFKMGAGDAYAWPDYSKEEMKKMNQNLDSNIKKVILEISNKFNLKEYRDYVRNFLSIGLNYMKTRDFSIIFLIITQMAKLKIQ